MQARSQELQMVRSSVIRVSLNVFSDGLCFRIDVEYVSDQQHCDDDPDACDER